jgi:multimeric flavodoxin WrbA
MRHASATKQLLLVWHSRTGFAKSMADALENGAVAAAKEMEAPLQINRKAAHAANLTDILNADGYLFCAPENLAGASGAMKEFFDRHYYQAFESSGNPGTAGYSETSLLLGKPFGLAISAGSDGSGAARQIERICRGWRLRPVAETLIERNGLPQTRAAIMQEPKRCSEEASERCRTLGGLLAASLLL